MAKAAAYPGLPRNLRVRSLSRDPVGPAILCRVVHCVSNEPHEETDPGVAATVHCPMGRFRVFRVTE